MLTLFLFILFSGKGQTYVNFLGFVFLLVGVIALPLPVSPHVSFVFFLYLLPFINHRLVWSCLCPLTMDTRSPRLLTSLSLTHYFVYCCKYFIYLFIYQLIMKSLIFTFGLLLFWLFAYCYFTINLYHRFFLLSRSESLLFSVFSPALSFHSSQNLRYFYQWLRAEHQGCFREWRILFIHSKQVDFLKYCFCMRVTRFFWPVPV